MNNIEQIASEKGVDTPFDLFVELNGQTFFAGDDGETGVELWASNGTTEGTNLFKDINPGGYDYYGTYVVNDSNPQNLTNINGKIYFSAETADSGNELWITDGTVEGTNIIKDINPGTFSTPVNTYQFDSNPSDFTELNGKVYFSARTEEGRELWVTDGTTEGTQILKNINPGGDSFYYYSSPIDKYGSDPEDLTQFNDKIYFSARVGVREEFQFDLFDLEDRPGDTGRELWVTDGTTEGTELVADINPGAEYSNPSDFSVVGDELLFTANNGETEQQYRVTLDGTVEPVDDPDPDEPNQITGTLGRDTIEGTEGDDRIKALAGDDVVNALGGNDTVFGDIFSDDLDGGDGNDIVYGGLGNDTIDGGAGEDTLIGEAGRDLFVLGADNGADTITDFDPEQDSFELSGELSFNDLTLTGNQIQIGDRLIATVEGIDTSSLTASNFNEEEPNEPNFIEGTLGRDTIEGTEGDDRIKALAGDDIVNALGGNDTVFGDIFSDDLDGGSGNDIVYGGLGNDTIDGGTGNDVLVGEEGNDFFVLTAGEGEDTITDFELESDRLILGGGLTFEDLSFSNDSILVESETLAILEGINTTQLQPDNFV